MGTMWDGLCSKVSRQFSCRRESIPDGIGYDLEYFIMPFIVSTELEDHRARTWMRLWFD